jgi:hypothetical protein
LAAIVFVGEFKATPETIVFFRCIAQQWIQSPHWFVETIIGLLTLQWRQLNELGYSKSDHSAFCLFICGSLMSKGSTRRVNWSRKLTNGLV